MPEYFLFHLYIELSAGKITPVLLYNYVKHPLLDDNVILRIVPL